MSLPNEEVGIFELFFEWIYSHEFSLLKTPKEAALNTACLITTAKLYVLADRYDILELRDDICSAFFHILIYNLAGPPKEVIDIVYAQTRPACKIRTLLIDW